MIKLREYQQDSIDKILENYSKGIKRNLAVLATGLGKTLLVTHLHKEFNPDKKAMFLVDRIDLAYQAQQAFKKTNSKWKIGIEMDKEFANPDDDVIISSIQTIGRTGAKRIEKFNPDSFGKIIVDEAHGSVTDSFFRALSYLNVGPDSKADKLLLGLTATPNRTDGVSLGVLYDDIVVNYDLIYAIKNGWLTDIELIHIDTGVDISTVKGTKNDFDSEELDKAINIAKRNALIVKAYMDYSIGENAIVFANSVKHGYEVSELFNHYNIPAVCIEANTDRDERQIYLEDFRRGRIKVLVNYGTLTTGFDAPETSTIILARPIKSDLLLRQIIGRGLRPSALCFIDSFDTADMRRAIISESIKPSCKVIDLHDMVGDHRLVTVPSLFGLSPNLKNNTNATKFLQEVVEPIEQAARESGVGVDKIYDLSEIDVIVKNRQKININSLDTPVEIKEFTDRHWLETQENEYEIVYPKEGKTLIISKNSVDKWDLLAYDKTDRVTKRLQTFQDISGAFSVADKLAKSFKDEHYNIEENLGVTDKQLRFLKQLYRGGIRISRDEVYEDTNSPKAYYRKTGELLDRKKANVLIKQRLR